MEVQILNSEWVQENINALVGSLQPDYFKSKRWFGSKGREINKFKLIDYAVLTEQPTLTVLVLLRIEYVEGNSESYHLPLIIQEANDVPTVIKAQANGIAAHLKTNENSFAAYDAFSSHELASTFYQDMFENQQFDSATGNGRFVFANVDKRLENSEVNSIKLIATEQSNTSIVYNGKLILKCFRKLAAGKNPDFEIPLFLTTHTNFRYVPKLAGYIEYHQKNGEPISMGVLQDFIKNIGDGYNYTLDQLRTFFRELEPELIDGSINNLTEQERIDKAGKIAQNYAKDARQLGYITGELHNALASTATKQDVAFQPELITLEDSRKWQESILSLIEVVMSTANRFLANAPANLRTQLESIADNKQKYLDVVAKVNELPNAKVNKIRYHGDYHLGQVLKTDESFAVLDFEGEPARTLAERRAKHYPLKDVTGMLRSFDYAAYAILFEEHTRLGETIDEAELEKWALAWEQVARSAFLEGYMEAAKENKGAKLLPDQPEILQQAIDVFETEKAFYELLYEINNRPDWIAIPLKGLQRILKS